MFAGLDKRERTKLIRLISYVVSIYIPSFGTIQQKPPAAEGPGITLFQRNLLLAYNEIDSELAEVTLKYFYDHAQQGRREKIQAPGQRYDAGPLGTKI